MNIVCFYYLTCLGTFQPAQPEHSCRSCRSPDQSCIITPLHKEPNPRPTADMIIRLGRLTPGYFRLLQRQVAGEVQTQPHDRAVNQIAMMLAIMGLSLSYYSAKRMTEKVQRLQKRRDSHTP